MLTLERGSPAPERREGRARLSVRDPQTEALLAGIFEGVNLDELRAVAKSLWRDRNRFDVGRRRHGLFGGGKLDKAGADRALRALLAAVERGEVL